MSRSSTPSNGQVTKVTATAKFKVEVHAPSGGSPSSSYDLSHQQQAAPPQPRRSRKRSGGVRKDRSGLRVNMPPTPPGASTAEAGSVHGSLSDSLRSSLSNSVSSSLSSNEGDLGFSEK